jgi:hypothetical protein
MGDEYITGEDVERVCAQLEHDGEVVLTHIIRKLEENPELLCDSVKIMSEEEPHIKYAKGLFAKRFSDAVGFQVDNDLFVEAMACLMPDMPDKKRDAIVDGALDYKRRNTQQYYMEGFGKEFEGNISDY